MIRGGYQSVQSLESKSPKIMMKLDPKLDKIIRVCPMILKTIPSQKE
jgi:hypothetical protein